MEQQPPHPDQTRANIISYPELQPVTPPTPTRKFHNLKLTVYALVLIGIGVYVFQNFINPSPPTLTGVTAESQNQTADIQTPSTNELMWNQAKTPLPTYPPIDSSTDLSKAASDIEIPDFADQITSLKELIAK